MSTPQPSFASEIAVSRPTPVALPVTIAPLPCSCMFFASDGARLYSTAPCLCAVITPETAEPGGARHARIAPGDQSFVAEAGVCAPRDGDGRRRAAGERGVGRRRRRHDSGELGGRPLEGQEHAARW